MTVHMSASGITVNYQVSDV